MEGWIKIHRQIKDHWLWKSERRLKWWFDILLTVNHSDSKILIKGNLIECKRGQSVRSLETWAKDWNVTKGAVRDFFKLLESDQMLYTESLQITTRITVCKYEDYQTSLHGEETHRKRKTNGKETHSIPKQEGEEEIKNNTWRNDFNIYLTECKSEYEKFMYDAELLKTQQRLNPGINIKLSIEKGFTNFWGTEAGWKFKKSKRSKEIDWKSTIINSIGINKVYLPK